MNWEYEICICYLDPLRKRVICVHEEEDMTCDKCKYMGDNDGYGISESKYLIEPSITTRRNDELDELGI